MILLISGQRTLQDLQAEISRRLLHGQFLQLPDDLLIGLYVLGITIDARCAEQLQRPSCQLLLQNGGATIKRSLLIEEFIDTLNHQHGCATAPLLTHRTDDLLEPIFHLALILRIRSERDQIQLIG